MDNQDENIKSAPVTVPLPKDELFLSPADIRREMLMSKLAVTLIIVWAVLVYLAAIVEH